MPFSAGDVSSRWYPVGKFYPRRCVNIPLPKRMQRVNTALLDFHRKHRSIGTAKFTKGDLELMSTHRQMSGALTINEYDIAGSAYNAKLIEGRKTIHSMNIWIAMVKPVDV